MESEMADKELTQKTQDKIQVLKKISQQSGNNVLKTSIAVTTTMVEDLVEHSNLQIDTTTPSTATANDLIKKNNFDFELIKSQLKSIEKVCIFVVCK